MKMKRLWILAIFSTFHIRIYKLIQKKEQKHIFVFIIYFFKEQKLIKVSILFYQNTFT